MTTRICFIRHGETDWNAGKRIQGQLDIPLNETGRAQALAMAMAFSAGHHEFAAIYSSDLVRARDTATALAQRCGLELQTMPALRERHFGAFQGLTGSEAAARHPQEYARYQTREPEFDFGSGESLLAFAARIEAAVDEIVRRHPGQTVAAVTHGGVLDILYRRATGRPLHTPRDFKVPNCALNWLSFDGRPWEQGGWHLEAWGDHYYLANVIKQSVE